MELPAPLRRAVDAFLERTPLSQIQDAAQRLSKRYRAETRDGSLHVGDALAAKAYLATRLPATYAAVRQCLAETAARREDFAPSRMLDVGAGPGTALWAAHAQWPHLGAATLVETSTAMREAGAELAKSLAIDTNWHATSVESGLADIAPADLVTLCYVLDELAPAVRDTLIDRLWALTADTLVIVEPGTPAGWQRILTARDRLIALGGHILAPCPHHAPWPGGCARLVSFFSAASPARACTAPPRAARCHGRMRNSAFWRFHAVPPTTAPTACSLRRKRQAAWCA